MTSLCETMRPVMPVPPSLLDPRSRHYRPGLGEPDPNGRYIDAVTKADITGLTARSGFIDVGKGRPRFMVSSATTEPADHHMGVLVRANLFRRVAGWRWEADPPEGLEDLASIVSVQTHAHHHYALRVVFEDAVTLWRNDHARCEPRLRPTTHGHLSFDGHAAGITIRGHQHSLWSTITISADVAQA